MNDQRYLTEYFLKFQEAMTAINVSHELIRFKDRIVEGHGQGKKMIIAGNGGSAAIASHAAVDFTKNANIRCTNFNEPSLMTCLANDYGYEHWVEKALEMYADDGDLVVLISSSGCSMNMIRAADYALQRGLSLVTFSGFLGTNPLRRLGHLNFWVKSKSYNFVETFHQLWLLSVCDLIADTRMAHTRARSETVTNTNRISSRITNAA